MITHSTSYKLLTLQPLQSIWQKAHKVFMLSASALILASCTTTPKTDLTKTTLPTAPFIPGTEHITYTENQLNLLQINGLELKGQVGVINAKKRYSAVFTFKQDKSGDYRLDLSIPYSSDQVSVIRYGSSYFYVQEGKAYTANTLSDFSDALFGFYVPLNLMKEILLGIQINSFNVDNNSASPKVYIENNIIKKETFQDNQSISYSGYSLVNNKYIVPKQISIVHDQDRLKIRIFDPYKYTERASYTASDFKVNDLDIKHAIKGKPPTINTTNKAK